mmetsp:Transcript_43645/g.123659  ORF Transcript_43645/g.123659 Transcript_43645/m.123659 type:complete len:224 (-) Transcript_43645:369-1040(-)
MCAGSSGASSQAATTNPCCRANSATTNATACCSAPTRTSSSPKTRASPSASGQATKPSSPTQSSVASVRCTSGWAARKPRAPSCSTSHTRPRTSRHISRSRPRATSSSVGPAASIQTARRTDPTADRSRPYSPCHCRGCVRRPMSSTARQPRLRNCEMWAIWSAWAFLVRTRRLWTSTRCTGASATMPCRVWSASRSTSNLKACSHLVRCLTTASSLISTRLA